MNGTGAKTGETELSASNLHAPNDINNSSALSLRACVSGY